jgi:Bacterial EndoU nuclease
VTMTGRGGQADRQDQPLPGDRRPHPAPDPWSVEGLRLRLDRLSAAHPSSPRYQGGRFSRPVNPRTLEFADGQTTALAAAQDPGPRDRAKSADYGKESGDAPPSDEDHAPGSGAWDEAGVASHLDRPEVREIWLPGDRRAHILDGDGPGSPGGGHRHGTGRPGKTEFPAGWDDDKIVSVVEDVARSPDTAVWQGFNSRWRVTGEREGVAVTSIVRPDGKIWSAWPEPGGAGVKQNPKA